ncbi:uncharacterized protein LOC142235695 [Haematobia irritans]|uniref:uncharacterized protein LOC142235695 n=1 Tax=Haematobia irritans TaxID=7368 RepID=UPI003F4F4896
MSTIDRKASSMYLLFSNDIKVVPGEFSVVIPTKGRRRMALLKMKLEACRLLEEGTKNFYLSMFMNDFLRVSNFPKKCPLLKNKLYYMRNYTIDDDKYPPFLPAGEWSVILKGKPNNIGLVTLTLTGRIRKL